MNVRVWIVSIGMAAGAATAPVVAQQGPPGPPQPLGAPPVPVENPQTAAKIALGQALFWEEQLSGTGTVACGTCHRAFAGGADPRSALAGADAIHPGPDAQRGSPDDIVASPGVPAHGGSGLYRFDPTFGYAAQVGTRAAPSMVNAAYSPLLFWDGRAGGTFLDPATGELLIAQGAALENQALGPLVNAIEMSPSGAEVNAVATQLLRAVPLVLADEVPTALSTWIAGRTYPELFADVFGSPEPTAARIAMAIASYERSLVSTQTPFDSENGGTPSLTDLERQGRQVFVANDCAACHSGALLSDNDFHYIGVRPVAEDLGRFVQNGDPADRGAFRTPSLRNGELRGTFMHDGRFTTLEQVVDFYDRGGDFTAPNKDARIRPRNLTAGQKSALVAFLKRPLTDVRVTAETGPFARPRLFTEGDRAPQIVSGGRAGSGGLEPLIGAIEPPLLGSRFTVSVTQALGGATATLVVSRADPGVQDVAPQGDFHREVIALQGQGTGNGHASVNVDLGFDPALVGTTLYGRFYIEDPAAPQGLAVTPAFAMTVFGESLTVFRADFE